jgi:vacuolar-type H+-ATPase subunit H
VSPDRPARRREIEDSTAARLAEIVAAAEQAARQVIDEAEEEARSRLSDAQEEADRIVAERLAGLVELTEEIDSQAEALRRQAEALRRALAAAKAELGGAEPTDGPAVMGRRRSDPGAEPEEDGRRPPAPALSIVGTPREEGADAPTSVGASAGARLLATQMAVSGSSRAEIEARLRDGFAIEDTGAILDAILGPEQ